MSANTLKHKVMMFTWQLMPRPVKVALYLHHRRVIVARVQQGRIF